MDDIWVIGQHGICLWFPWMIYGSLVNMVVAYGVMVLPIDNIWVVRQHGVCLSCPWMTYGSLVNMVLAYGVMVLCMDDIWVIDQHGICLWCPWMTYGSVVNMVVDYGVMEHALVEKCIEMRNQNILFRNGLMKLFFLDAEHEGKTMLGEASALRHLDSTHVLGMMLMVQGRHMKEDALDMLNNAYHRGRSTWNVRATCSKVHLSLNREGKKHVHFNGFHRSYALQKSVISVSYAFVNGYKCVFMCEISLWDACYARFSSELVIIYE
ncbi:unnamed protein product [Lactuca saligna]|uniref:At2g35280-like TPR domain-containing protein n=1 Tax=Lactuca saligna TaxID=75948 RepID=A0AA35V7W3_LACSI|nr:unnamed protein product [Lactuca saligna]